MCILGLAGSCLGETACSKKVLDELALLDVSEYTVIRDGQDVRVASDALVLGDLVRLESGQQIPADAIVASGEVGVNESLLTGEADEILRSREARTEEAACRGIAGNWQESGHDG